MDLSDLDPSELDVVILPITGKDKDEKVEVVFSNQKIVLTENWFKKLKESAIVFTGMSSPYLTKQMEQAKATFAPLLDRDDVAIYNSIPTAEGTIMMAMQHT